MINRPQIFKMHITFFATFGLLLTSVLIGYEAHSRDFTPGPLDITIVMKQPIDVSAQRSLVRLSNGDKNQKYLAHFIHRSVAEGAIGGIYIVNQGVPALRAKALGKGWWELLDGRPAMCWKEPQGEKPLIIISKNTAANPAALDSALLTAYEECGHRELEITIMKNGNPCIPKSSWGALINKKLGIDYGVLPSKNGVAHLSMPPGMYQFDVVCEGELTSPPLIDKEILPGEGVQEERFDF